MHTYVSRELLSEKSILCDDKCQLIIKYTQPIFQSVHAYCFYFNKYCFSFRITGINLGRILSCFEKEVRHLNKGSLLSFFNLIVLEIMAWVAVSLSVKEGKLATCSSID